MKKLLVSIMLLFVAILVAEEQPANILLNGELDCGTASMPEGWTFDYVIPGICYAEGGPGNSPQVVFSAPADEPVELGGMRQQMLNLVQGKNTAFHATSAQRISRRVVRIFLLSTQVGSMRSASIVFQRIPIGSCSLRSLRLEQRNLKRRTSARGNSLRLSSQSSISAAILVKSLSHSPNWRH